jgi:transcriptional regulator with XRE-family HTH domain
MAISVESRAYFRALGARISHLRREQGITQAQLADILEVSQQTVFAYEAGERRVSLSLLPLLAKTLGVSIEGLVGTEKPVAGKKQHPSPVLLRQLELIQQLPKEHQRFITWLITTLVKQYHNR